MLPKVHGSFQKYGKVTFLHMTRVQMSFKVSYTTLTAAWKYRYTFIKGYHMLCTCQHLSRAGAGRSTVHHFMTMTASTHLLLRRDRLTCPCTAEPIIASSKLAAVLTQTLTYSATVFEDDLPLQ